MASIIRHPAAAPASGRVLAIDDDTDFGESLDDLLTSEGYEVAFIDGAEGALALFGLAIGMLEFHRAAEAIEEGESCVQKSMPKIRSLMGNR